MPREIIPAIIAKSSLEFEEKLIVLEKAKIPLAQIDIMDGQFVTNSTMADPKIAAKHKLDYELHLMTEDPELYLEEWKNVPTVKRVAIHAEIKKPLAPIIKKIQLSGWEVGLALNPNTSWSVVEPYLVHNPSPPPLILRGGKMTIDFILVMAVYPGRHAAPFVPKVVPKIKNLHAAHPRLIIEIDGGVNEQTLPVLLSAGATRFAVGSALWSAPNFSRAYQQLLQINS